MNIKLRKEWDRLIVAKKELFKTLNTFSEKEQNHQVDEYTWSMVGVIEHLVISEGGILKFFDRYPPKASKYKATFKSNFKSRFLNFALWSPFRFKAPVKILAPKQEKTLATLEKEWDTIRKDWETLLEDFPNEKINYTVFKHPLAGPVTMLQTLQFMRNHIYTHEKQLRRIGKKVKN